MKLIFNTILLTALLFAPSFAFADNSDFGKSEFKKEINKTFDVNLTDKLLLENRHGKVDVKTWNEPRVTIDVIITVNARKESDAQEVFDRIKIEMNQSGGLVTAKTEIEDQGSWSSWLWGGSSSDYKIDYLVHMPAAHSLSLSNKYGHSYVENFEGDGDMTIKYGDLYAGNIGGNLNLYLGYGNAEMGNTKNAKCEVKYSKIKLKQCQNVNMEIKYSKFYLESANALKLTSGYDDLNLGNVGSLSAYSKYSDLELANVGDCDIEAKYTDIRIDHLDKSGIFELGYGGLSIDYIRSDFSELEVTAKYADIKLHPDPNGSYSLSAETKYASIRYPDQFEVRRDINANNTHEVSGYQKSESGGKIKLSSSYGSVRVY